MSSVSFRNRWPFEFGLARSEKVRGELRHYMRIMGTPFLVVALFASLVAHCCAFGIEGFANRTVSGAFVQITGSNALNGNVWWKGQVDQMANLGMDTLVVQYGGADGFAFYPQSRSFATTLNGIGTGTNAHNPIRAILEQAELRNVEVYLGVYKSSAFDNAMVDGNNAPAGLVQTTINNAKASLDDLEVNYGWDPSANGGAGAPRYDSLGGYYFPQEINNFVALSTTSWNHDREIIDYTKQLANYAKTETGLKTMISPFFNLNLPMTESGNGQTYAQWWNNEALNTATGGFDVNIVAMQDGVGAGIVGHSDPGLRRHATVISAAQQFGTLTTVFDQHNEDFWGNVEAFEQTSSSITQASFTRFRNQITAVAPHVDRTIAFDFPHYLNSAPENPKYGGTGPGGIPAATQHLNVKLTAYKSTESKRLDVKQYWYEPSSLGAAFYPQAADPNELFLADLNTGALDIPAGGSAFVNGTWVGFDKNVATSGGGASNADPQIVFDLYSAMNVRQIELFFIEDASAGILNPGLSAISIKAGSTTNPSSYTTITPTNSSQSFAWGESNLKMYQMVFNLPSLSRRYYSIKVTTPNRFVFMGEAAFYLGGTGGASPIPEPSSWAMLFIGLVLNRVRARVHTRERGSENRPSVPENLYRRT